MNYMAMKNANNYLNRFDEILNTMVCGMKSAPRTCNISLDFVNEMIPHHEGAIQMCKNLLQYNIDPTLKKIAQNIITEQSRGVEELKAVRRRLTGR